MVEKILLYPSHTLNLIKIKNSIYKKVAELKAEVSESDEPVTYSDVKGLSFHGIKKGQIWATDFGCAWFRFTGEVPLNVKGRKAVALVNIGGEGLVYKDGVPVVGITQVTDGIDLVQSAKGKQEVLLSECAEGGEKVDFLVDAGYNGKKKKTGTVAKFGHAYIAVCDEESRGFYYDYLQLFMLLLTKGKNIYLSDQRAKDIDNALSKAYSLWRKGEKDKARDLLKNTATEKIDYKAPEYTAIGHAHLDLAYLWPIRETKRKGARTFANQLVNIKKYPDYVFGASQAQLFDWMKELYPQIYEQIKQSVADDRIEIQGAMWTENDCNIPSGESIIRQFVYGEEFFRKEFSKSSKVVWLPDVFGYPASLPQIFKGCGKDFFATIKLTWNNHNKFPYKTFMWEGVDGSRILSHMAPQGNYNSTATPFAFVKSFDGNPQKEQVPHALMIYGIGDGGGGPGEAPLELLRRERGQNGLVNVKTASAQSFFEELQSDENAVIPVFKGELYLEKHQGTYTSQARNKLYNRLMEKELHTFEWLTAIALLKGVKWDKKAYDDIWKEVLLYQFHDILPGSSIKRVFDESVARYKIMHSQLAAMRDRLLVSFKKGDCKSAVNPIGFCRTEYVKDGAKWYVASVDPYSVGKLEDYKDEGCLSAGSNFIQNDVLRVEFSEQGWIKSLTDVKTGKQLCKDYLNKLVVYEDPKLFYNAWDIREDYRSLPKDTFTLRSMQCYVDGASAVMSASYVYGASSLTQTVTIKPHDALVEFDTHADWHEDFKMLRAEFVPTVYSDKVNCDIQFANVDRDTADDTPLRKAQFEICAHKFVNVDGEDSGFAVLSNCKYGYRVKDGYISLNLLRSPKRPDPECDRGEHYFGYAIYVHSGKWNESDLVKRAYRYEYPLYTCDFAPDVPQIVDDGEDGVITETVKPSHDGKGIVVRLYERYGESCEITLKAGFAYKAVYFADMLERKSEKLTSAKIAFSPYEIKTLYFEL